MGSYTKTYTLIITVTIDVNEQYTINGSNGNDTLQSPRYSYNNSNIFIGGIGNDTLVGNVYSADLYQFEKGHGQDILDDYVASGEVNTAEFKGASSTHLKLTRHQNQSDLVIQAYNTDDSVRIVNYFTDSRVRNLQFKFEDKMLTADGITDFIKNIPVYINGTEEADQLNGLTGRNLLDGKSGDDILNGSRYAYDNGNIFIGGAGNDVLNGNWYSADTYRFDKGHGQDIINDRVENGEINTLEFINTTSENLILTYDKNDLIVQAYNSEDQVKILNYFIDENVRILEFKFDDKTLTCDDIEKQVSKMPIYINGTEDADSLKGSNFADIIYGSNGDDVIEGGYGNDILMGAAGSDIYIFAEAHGNDVISDFDYQPNMDYIWFKDLRHDEVQFSKQRYDLVLFSNHSDDSVSIQNFFLNSAYQVEKFIFSDNQLIENTFFKDYEKSANVMIDAMAGFQEISASDSLISNQSPYQANILALNNQ